MTDQNQTPDPQETPQPPEDAVTTPPGTVTPADDAAESLEKTIEVETRPDLDKTLEVPLLPPDLEPTVEMQPAVPAAEQPTEVTLAVDGLVPPPTPDLDQTLTDATLGDTSDFTLSDMTLGDAGGNRLLAWLRGLKKEPSSADAVATAPTPESAAKSRRWGLRPWQWTLIGVGALVFVLAVLISVDGGLYYNRVHHGIEVAGQDLSGMSSAKAVETLSGFADEAQKKPITLASGKRTWRVLPGDLGTVIDVPAAVANAMALTRQGNVFTDLAKKISLYFSGDDIPLEGTFDKAKMDALLTGIAEALDVPAVNATLAATNGAIEVVEGKQGSLVDQEALRKDLTSLLFTLHSTELSIPMVTASPDLSAVDVEPSLAQANMMISADLVLTYKGKTLATLKPEEILTYIDVTAGSGDGGPKTVPVLSVEKMSTFFDSIQGKVGSRGVNATFEMDFDVEPYALKLVEGSNGEGLDREATAAALTQAALGTGSRSVEVPLKSVPPDITTEEVQAMGIKDLLGDYKTTPYVGTKNRQQNVRLATKLCSGVFLAPGEEFNTDQRLGVRDEAHGWATAPGIVGPGQLEDVFGGGICQVSTTLFNAALLAGLEITKRYNHSIYINHYPDGRDATVTAGGKNMCFRDDTDHYVFIYGWSTGINTRFWIWGVNDGRKVLPIKFSGFSGFAPFPTQTIINKSLPPGTTKEVFEGQRSRRCYIERTIVYADGTEETVRFSSYYPMMPKVIETGPTPATTTTGGSGTTGSTAAPTSTTLAP